MNIKKYKKQAKKPQYSISSKSNLNVTSLEDVEKLSESDFQRLVQQGLNGQ